MGPSEFYLLKTVLQIRVTAFKTYNFLYYVNNFLLRGVNDTAELTNTNTNNLFPIRCYILRCVNDTAEPDSTVSMTPRSLSQYLRKIKPHRKKLEHKNKEPRWIRIVKNRVKKSFDNVQSRLLLYEKEKRFSSTINMTK